MYESQPRTGEHQPVSRRGQADQLCDEFERQWRSGNTPRIEEKLERIVAEHRGDLLEELVAVEVQLRCSAGQSVSLEEYKSHFKDHSERVCRAFELGQSRSQSDADKSMLETRSVMGKSADETASYQPRKVGPREVDPSEGDGPTANDRDSKGSGVFVVCEP